MPWIVILNLISQIAFFFTIIFKKEEKMKQAENRTKEKIRRIMARLKGSKQVGYTHTIDVCTVFMREIRKYDSYRWKKYIAM